MTEREKAKELVDKMYYCQRYVDGENYIPLEAYKRAKQCVLIAVDEIILSAPFEPVDTDWDEAGSSAQYWYPQKLEDSAKWWAEVKQEIENL